MVDCFNKMEHESDKPVRKPTAREEAEAYGIDVNLLDDQIQKTPVQRFQSLVQAVNLIQQINPRIAQQNVSASDDSYRPAERAF